MFQGFELDDSPLRSPRDVSSWMSGIVYGRRGFWCELYTGAGEFD